jgi:hypothetical protein
MIPNKLGVILPILLITLGSGWLLTTLGVAPGIDWVWTLGLAVLGLLVMALGGIDKVTVALGPFLITASFLSVLRQTDRLNVDTEVPILVVVAGVLLLVVRMPTIPLPKWVVQQTDHRRDDH